MNNAGTYRSLETIGTFIVEGLWCAGGGAQGMGEDGEKGTRVRREHTPLSEFRYGQERLWALKRDCGKWQCFGALTIRHDQHSESRSPQCVGNPRPSLAAGSYGHVHERGERKLRCTSDVPHSLRHTLSTIGHICSGSHRILAV